MAAKSSSSDNDKLMGVLAYIGILVLIPLLAGGDSKFIRFQANQGLVLFIALIVVNILWIIPFLGWVIAPLVTLGIVVLAILGIINVLNGEQKPLPLIGGITLIK